ncbi:MAG: ATP synthase F1 subunit epsilon [Candidatus Caldatribacteriaceae bacterium]
MKVFELRIIAPDRTIVLSRVQSIVFDCPDGKRGVLPGHEHALFELAIGVLRCVDDTGKRHYFSIAGGVAEVNHQRVIITTDSVEEAHEIDIERAKTALERAEKRLREKALETDFVRAQSALLRALARLRASEYVQKSKGR